MRKYLFRNMLLLFSISLFVSCSGSKSKTTYEALIPVNQADIITAINFDKLLTKSDLHNLATPEEWQQVKLLLSQSIDQQESVDFIFNLLQNPNKSPLDLSQTTYIVARLKEEGIKHVLFASAVKEESQIVKLLEGLEDSTSSNEFENYKHYEINGVHILVAKQICFVYSGGDKDDLKLLINSQSTLSEQRFLTHLKESDIGFAFDLKTWSSNYQNLLAQSTPASTLSLDSFYSQFEGPIFQIAEINFEQGKVIMNQKIEVESEQDQATLTHLKEIFSPIQNTYSKWITKDPLLYASFGLNGEKTYPVIAPLLEKSNLITNPDVLNFIQLLAKSTQGDFAVSLSDLEIGFFKQAAKVNLFIPIKEDSIYQKLIALLKSDENFSSLIKNESAEMIQLTALGQDVYIGKATDYIYLSTDKRFTQDPVEVVNNPLSETRYFSNSQNAVSYISLDLAQLIQNPMVQTLVVSSIEQEPIKQLLQSLDYLDFRSNSDFTSQGQLVLKGTKDNALKVLTLALLELSRM